MSGEVLSSTTNCNSLGRQILSKNAVKGMKIKIFSFLWILRARNLPKIAMCIQTSGIAHEVSKWKFICQDIKCKMSITSLAMCFFLALLNGQAEALLSVSGIRCN